jgi:hypothetical protein
MDPPPGGTIGATDEGATTRTVDLTPPVSPQESTFSALTLRTTTVTVPVLSSGVTKPSQSVGARIVRDDWGKARRRLWKRYRGSDSSGVSASQTLISDWHLALVGGGLQPG